MTALVTITGVLGAVNAALLALGRALGATALAVMVAIILAQVFFRYVLGSALAWPEEAARFLMLWIVGLMAPTAFRRGGFVSIEVIRRLLPRGVAAVLNLCLLALSLLILVAALRIGWAEVTGLGGRFATDSLKVPASFDFSQWAKVPKAWMMASLVVGCALLISVCVELMLRNLADLFGAGDRLAPIPDSVSLGAE